MIQRQQVTLTGTDDKIGYLLDTLHLEAKYLDVTVTITPTSVTDATVGVTQDSQQNSRQSEECACCGTRLDINGVRGLAPSIDAPEFSCGCRWCWHCGNNRGKYEGHDPKACSEQSQQNPRQREESMDEQGWLIERGGLCLGLQCGGPAWVAFTDPNAIRFAREIDAKNMLSGLRKFGETNGAFKDCIVTGHMWVGPPDAQGSVTEQSQQKSRQDGE